MVGDVLDDFLRAAAGRGCTRARPPSRRLAAASWAKSASDWARAASPREAAASTARSKTRWPRAARAAVVKRVGCVGMCHQTPLVELIPPAAAAAALRQSRPDEAADIVLRHFKPRGILRRAGYAASRWLDRLLTDEIGDPVARHAIDVRDGPVCAFLGPQMHLATEYCGQLDPTDLDEYLRHDGFVALRHCLETLSPEQVIETIEQSGLRGRGGAGFPTGLKWAEVRAAAGEKKYVICNGDEGDPGAFMDRMLLESFPYRIIEGMCIAAQSVGA